MILACHNLNKSFGDHLIVRDGSFHVEDREKAALVGVNGAGKSTIFKMIVGELPLDDGDVILTKGKTLGYLAQHQNLDTQNTIYEELKTAKSDIISLEEQIRSIELELKSLTGDELNTRLNTYNRLMSEFENKNGYAYESEITGVLKGLGFTEEDFSKPTDTLSGGQKTRVSLGKLLLTKPDILLLDEPTNHLDLNSISWLETYLLNYPGAVLIVSHDRFFLNRVVTKVIEIEHEKPAEAVKEMHFTLEPSEISGNDVLSIQSLGKQFDSQVLFRDISFEIKRGEHVAIIGDNGTGKTTLLKILNQVVEPDTGSFTLGSKVQIGYYDQEHHVLHNEKTIFDEISDDYPTLTNTQIRNTLAAFQFTGDDVYKLIRDLSGGEKGRVSLAKLMLSEANFLILDEPTNHLDITSKEILEQALNEYTGTVLYVSHDRYFINQTATRILELVNQTFVNYIGNYDYYLEKKEELTAAYAAPITAENPVVLSTSQEAPSDSKLSWQEQKEQQAKERKRKNELKKTEDRIAVLEERNEEIDMLMTQEEVYSNSVKCQELALEKDANNNELEELYEKWEELAE